MSLMGDFMVDVPGFLDREWLIGEMREVEISRLYVGLISVNTGEIGYRSIIETPHYAFVRHVLFDESVCIKGGYRDYEHYISINEHPCDEEKFKQLIRSIQCEGYRWMVSPILVFRSVRRPWPLGRWDVADGFHRLAVLAAMDVASVRVCTLIPKESVVRKIGRTLHDRR